MALVLYLCVANILRYLIKMGITKIFIILFYACSLLILLADLFIAVYLFVKLPKEEAIDLNAIPTVNFLTISDSVHMVVYTGLILQMVCGMSQITTGLKMSLPQKTFSSVKQATCILYAFFSFCILLFMTVIFLEVISYKGGKDVTFGTRLLLNCVLAPILILMYAFWLCDLFKLLSVLRENYI